MMEFNGMGLNEITKSKENQVRQWVQKSRPEAGRSGKGRGTEKNQQRASERTGGPRRQKAKGGKGFSSMGGS